MTNEDQNYTPEFKKEVAQKALDQSKQNLEGLSEKYEVPVSVILMWATELEKGGEDVFKESHEDAELKEESSMVDIEVNNQEIASSVDHGVMFDNLNYKRLAFWTVLGLVMFLIIIQSLIEVFQFNSQALQDRVSAESGEYYQAVQQKQEAKERINSFGVVNLEEGTYRVPVDSVINKMAVDEE
ncbi:MAG TPA: hypothetical protein VK112_07280 [Fodinibius sp.]|nr:hypothetical protein [Fodinibius sp.]